MRMFQSATLKLTAWYLALMMGVSLAFSLVLYNSSAESLSVAYDHQGAAIKEQFFMTFGMAPAPAVLDRLRDNEIGAAQQRLVANLTLANLGVLIAGGAASFFLARRTLRPIEQTLEAQVRFTADASHELRTPLTAMQTEIEVTLRDKNMTLADARELLESNLEEVRRLQDLGNGLLALANQDQEHFVPERVQTGAVLKDALARTAKIAQQKRILVENKATNQHVWGSKEGLVQLFAVLVDNAIKYSPADSTITLRSRAKGGDAFISVQDHGYGIRAEDLPHIFDRLYRADSSRTKGKVNGYGLGLSIAKKIVELHKGSIDATSKVGEGSTFTVRIPLAPKVSEKEMEG